MNSGASPINRRPSVKKSSSSSSSSSSGANQAKKSIDCSQASVQSFVYMCFMFVFKRFVFAPTYIKIGIYLSALVVCSIIRDFSLVTVGTSTNYLAQKHNILNQYFVKLGWAWTLAALVPFVTMTSLIYTSCNLAHVKNHLSRILVATVAWYVLTNAFDLLDSHTGHCTKQELLTKVECKRSKHEWVNGFDVSGHTFLLIYSLLIMIEEVRIFNEWDSFHRKLVEKVNNSKSASESSVYVRAESLYQKLTPYIRANFVFMALLALLWEVMLLTTFLFFHTMLHKLFAASFAIFCWFITYRSWYVNKSVPWTPGLPGDGSI